MREQSKLVSVIFFSVKTFLPWAAMLAENKLTLLLEEAGSALCCSRPTCLCFQFGERTCFTCFPCLNPIIHRHN